MPVKFEGYSIQVQEAIKEKAVSFLYEAAELIKSQTMQLTPVRTGQLKGSWDYKVDEEELKAEIGSPLENAIWNELGTGEYAANGDGRKGGWFYQDDDGNWVHTFGKHPKHSLQKAFTLKKNSIINMAKELFNEIGT